MADNNLTAKEAIKNFQKTVGYTNEAIIKALECCKGFNKDCEGCVLCDESGCDDKLKKLAADRIRDLDIELKAMRMAANSYKMHYEEAKSKGTRDILSDLKIAVHNKAIHTNAKEVPTFITLREFDAILQNYLNKLK